MVVEVLTTQAAEAETPTLKLPVYSDPGVLVHPGDVPFFEMAGRLLNAEGGSVSVTIKEPDTEYAKKRGLLRCVVKNNERKTSVHNFVWMLLFFRELQRGLNPQMMAFDEVFAMTEDKGRIFARDLQKGAFKNIGEGRRIIPIHDYLS